MNIGILALQGTFEEHQKILSKCGADTLLIHNPEEIKDIDGLVIPGGESTTIGKLMQEHNFHGIITENAYQGMPILGTSAGMILMAKDIMESDQYSLRLMDIRVGIIGFDCRLEKFQSVLAIDALGKATFPGVFIRAPYVESVKPNVGILAEFDGKIVMVRQGNFLGTAFHPELTDDLRVHLYFKQMVEDAKG